MMTYHDLRCGDSHTHRRPKTAIPALFLAISCLVYLFCGLSAAGPARAAGSGVEVVDLVNQLRAANGLEAYAVNAALMAAAQGHSEWMAEAGTTSHTGASGSSPASRAAGAGYGGSGVVENIASGAGMTPAGAVRIWQADSLHLNTLLSSTSLDAGAGVAVSADGATYITLLVGGRGDSSGGATGQSQGGSSAGAAAATPPTAEILITVQTATPGTDGSITHVVEPGQTLWEVAVAYKVSLNDLYALNGLDAQAVIVPGERLIIRGASLQRITPTTPLTETVTAETDTPAPALLQVSPTEASPTVRPATRTPAPIPSRSPAEPQAAVSQAADTDLVASSAPGQGLDPLLAIITGVAVLGVGLMLIGALLKRGA